MSAPPPDTNADADTRAHSGGLRAGLLRKGFMREGLWRTILLRLLGACALLGLLYALKLPPNGEPEPAHQRPLRVALFVNGTLGDKSFYDSAARGLQAARRDLGLHTRVIEAGLDPMRWESSLADLAESGDFDIVVTGGFAMVALVQGTAPLNPRTRFIVFDAAVNPAVCRCENVHSMLFRQNEGAYLAGVLAVHLAALPVQAVGSLSPGPGPVSAPAPVLGVVGAMQIPVIDDFIVGFNAGASAAMPGARVLRQYVNSFTDPATAKEIAKALYGQGVPLIFQVAAGSGQGVIEAAAEAGRWVIGVDSDQYALFKASHPLRARHIASSVLKNVDVAVLTALRRAHTGQQTYGGMETLGLAEGGVSLATGSEAMNRLPPAVLAELAQAQQAIVAGRIRVPSAFDRPLP